MPRAVQGLAALRVCRRYAQEVIPDGVIKLAGLAIAWPLPRQASLHGAAIDEHLLLNLWVILGLAAITHGLLAAGLLRRRSMGAAGSSLRRTLRVEMLPLVLFTLLFGGLAFQAERLWADARYTGASRTAMQVEVTGMQFVWTMRYPGPDRTFGRTDPSLVDAGAGNPLGLDARDRHAKDDFVTSELVLPAGREVDVALKAQDVIHGFAVPEMRLKQNAIPGETVHLHFTPSVPGTYAILCTQLCGLGHYRMAATLRVLSPSDFNGWLSQHEATTTP